MLQSVAEGLLAHQFAADDQLVAELAGNHRTYLGDFLAQSDPIEPRYRRVAKGFRDRDAFGRIDLIVK
jgi:hypothetical protein